MSTSAFAQNITLKGKVSDEQTKETLPAVNIMVKGTKQGTITDASGSFTINVKPDAILVFAYVGYKRQEITIKGQTTLNVMLVSDNAGLDEVMVVGYGTKKKINVAGAIDQISGKQFESRPVSNVMQGLQGVSPGLNITYGGGAPGTVPIINIRGMTSINGGSPLIVIDGIPAASNDDLLRLTPADISSYTVLRDAASAAIYGARAAFGVILITTRQGTAGQQTISYNMHSSWGRPTVLPKPVTDPYIYARVLETSVDNTPWNNGTYSDEFLKWARERSDNPSLPDTRLDPKNPSKWAYMGSNDWYKYFLNNASFSQNHSLTFSGGATVDNNLNIYQTKKAYPYTSITDLYYLKPTDVAVNPDGTWANTDAGRLSAKLKDGGSNLETMFGFQNITSATATFLNGDLVVNGDASFKRELWKYHVDNKKYKIGFGPNDVREEGGTGNVSEKNGYLYNNAFNLYTTYRKTIGSHFFSAMVGYSSEDYNYSTTTAARDGLISSSLPYLGLTSGTASV
eukprot:gene15751-18989_t